MMRLVLLSDIHANVTALQAVLNDVTVIGNFDNFVILGDVVNYGPRPNETLEIIRQLPKPILVNLWGNHEYSIFGGNLDRFATDRGRIVLKYTNDILKEKYRTYISKCMNHQGKEEKNIDGNRFLFVHGNLKDSYWGKFDCSEFDDYDYARYDYVVSGHSHIPHYVEHFFISVDEQYRNKKRTIFINPGSVGQPRNHNPFAQYGILDTCTGNYEHRSVWYDVKEEQKYFCDEIDSFYKDRLTRGI